MKEREPEQAQGPQAPIQTEATDPAGCGGSAAAKRGRPESAPFTHGKGYAIRRRYRGQDIFLSGFATQAQAKRAMREKMRAIDQNERPWGLGPERTCVAQALQDYAMERLPYLKGAPQEARRINNFLRAAGLRLLEVVPVPPEARPEDPKNGRGAEHVVSLQPHTSERKVPKGLHGHRKALLAASANTERHRAALAGMPMAEVTRKMVQDYIDAMRKDGHSPATIALERSVLRVLFNHAFTTWKWTALQDNPATRVRMPEVRNTRTRVLSFKEQELLDAALHDCRNGLASLTIVLLRETAMRASEPLEHAKWRDVDWQRKVLKLRDGKTGAREVPLSPAALEALLALQELGAGKPDEPIVQVTYEALKAAWRRACARAGIEDLRIHDLRHTAATRLALKSGNVFLVKALTGHQTIQMLERYVNVGPDDVVNYMHQPTGGPDDEAQTPQDPLKAGAGEAAGAAVDARAQAGGEEGEAGGAKVYQFPARRAA